MYILVLGYSFLDLALDYGPQTRIMPIKDHRGCAVEMFLSESFGGLHTRSRYAFKYRTCRNAYFSYKNG